MSTAQKNCSTQSDATATRMTPKAAKLSVVVVAVAAVAGRAAVEHHIVSNVVTIAIHMF